MRNELQRVADLMDAQHVSAVERLQDAAWSYEPVERVPVILHGAVPPDWPSWPYNELFDNPEKMLAAQLLQPYLGVALRDDRILCIRADYGPAIIPSLFGAAVHVDGATTWVGATHNSRAIRAIVERGLPDLEAGLGARVFETEQLYRGCLEASGLAPYVHVFQADNQSPFDCAYLLWGEEIYLALYDEPDLVHALLDLIARTIVAFVSRQKAILREPCDQISHWWYRVPAGVRVVDDVAVTLSPRMYAEFVRPYNERVFAAFGSGYMHYCGHLLQSQHLRLATRGLRGIEMGAEDAWRNPAYTLEAIWRQAAQHRVAICWIGPRLPDQRPAGIETGLIYGDLSRGLSWDDAPRRLAALRTYWNNAGHSQAGAAGFTGHLSNVGGENVQSVI
jgi:hypothetical protein